MKHVYWVVTCKTPKCGLIAVKYIGEHDGQPIHFLPAEGPGWWNFECGTCGKAHRYTRQELHTTLLDYAPPPEFRPWW